jgi:hypothetical protein
MSLKDEGFRFVIRGGSADWVHPSLVQCGDVDATDLSDEEFEYALGEGMTTERHPYACARCEAERAGRCQYAADVGMPEYRCAGKCQYESTCECDIEPTQEERDRNRCACCGGLLA